MGNQQLLTKEESEVKELLEKDFIPSLEMELKRGKSYHMIVNTYGFNYCRQAVLLSYSILKELLPSYKWEAWESVWECSLTHLPKGENRAKFDHAWLYGYDEKQNRHLIVDLTLEELEQIDGQVDIVHKDYSSMRVVEGNLFPNDMDDYYDVVVRSKKQMKVEEMVQTKDIYTNMKGDKLLKQVVRGMKNKSLVNNLIRK